MIIDAKNLDEKPENDINRESRKLTVLSLGKMISMNILNVRKYWLLIKVESQSKLCLLILLQGKLLKTNKKTKPRRETNKVHEEYGKQLIKSSAEKESFDNFETKTNF